ncbi:MAG TPA: substrate-binding domain-containing protein [Streptosporangiaceae bacterium]
MSATAAASALLAACGSKSGGSTANAAASGAVGDFPATPKYKFTFVNHVTDNAFFTPTQYGFQDCAALLGLSTPSWTGATSTQPTVPTMLTSLNAAIAANSDGIATTVVDATAFVSPINKALTAGIPVVTYNANGATNNPTNGLAYIGQELFASGQEVGARIAAAMPHGGTACGIIAQPGSLNIQPRLDGANAAILAAGKGLKILHTAGFDSGASQSQETTSIPEFIQANGPKLQGVFAVDGGSTALLGPALAKFSLVGKVAAGGFDLEPATLTAVKAGQLDFTIDQSPYLQGFLPCLYLYMFQLSGGLVAPPETDTGLKFVTKDNVAPYTSPASRFEGSTKAEALLKRSGPITV